MRPAALARRGGGVAACGAALYVAQRAAPTRWRAGPDERSGAFLTLPADLRHRFVATSDGGRIHVVERGEGPATVLVHGITLGVATWAPQLRDLGGRVVALSQRGHGESRAGSGGYGFDRLGADLLETLDAVDVRDAVLVGHSMGGMVAQLLAVTRHHELAARVRRLVLVATTPGPVAATPLAALLGPAAALALAGAARYRRRPLPPPATVWAARLAFGASPRRADVELLASMLDAMSPGALAQLVPHVLYFDARDRLGAVALPTHVVVGTRDVLTPQRTARELARRVSGAALTVLPGSGHMVMLERPVALRDLVRG